jgi:predicted O-linked N-acetylglucosamine transferase (SPINDLY family)
VFNRLIKVTPQMIRLWAELLKRIPVSKLMVLARDFDRISELRQRLGNNGIPVDRLTFAHAQPRNDFLQLFNEVDIALDTFPYSGHTTTCDALWMGVPTVTLAGNRSASRAGVGVLSAAGLEDFISRSSEEYLTKAEAVARDLPQLAALRARLRQRVQRSSLCDAAGLTRAIEAAFRRMWADWCQPSV